MKNLLKVLTLVFVSVLLFTGCDAVSDEVLSDFNLGGEKGPERSCTLVVTSEDKDTMSSYSFDIYIDGDKTGETVNKNNSKTFVKSLSEGSHKMKVMSGVTSSEEVSFTVSETATKFEFGCSKKDSVSLSLYLK